MSYKVKININDKKGFGWWHNSLPWKQKIGCIFMFSFLIPSAYTPDTSYFWLLGTLRKMFGAGDLKLSSSAGLYLISVNLL